LKNDRAPALTEGMRILELVGDSPEGNSFETILKSVKMSRSSVNRLLKNLINSGYLVTRPGLRGVYYPGPRLFSLAYQVNRNHRTMEAMHSALQEVARRTRSSCQYAVFDRSFLRIIILDKAETTGSIHLAGPGYDITRFANRHGMGKVILAHCSEAEKRGILAQVETEKKTSHTVLPGPELDSALSEIREKGYALDLEESDDMVYRVSVGVFSPDRVIQGALCCTWNARRLDEEKVHQSREELAGLSEASAHFYLTR